MGRSPKRRAGSPRWRPWLLAAIALLVLAVPLATHFLTMRSPADDALSNASIAAIAPSTLDAPPSSPRIPSPNQPPQPQPPVLPGPRARGTHLDGSITLDGIVVDRVTGRAIADAAIGAHLPHATDRTTSNQRGEFSLVLVRHVPDLDPPRVPEVNVEHPRYVERTFRWPGPIAAEEDLSEDAPVRIELERGVKLAGHVGVPDVKLCVTAFAEAPCDLGRRVIFTHTTRSRDDGTFAFVPLPSTPSVEVTVESDGVCVQRLTDLSLRQNLENLVIHVGSDVAVSARAWAALSPAERTRAETRTEYASIDLQLFLLAGDTGDPLAGALVLLSTDRGDERHVHTTSAGQLTLRCPRGTVLLTIASPGFEPLQAELADGAFISPAIITLQRQE